MEWAGYRCLGFRVEGFGFWVWRFGELRTRAYISLIYPVKPQGPLLQNPFRGGRGPHEGPRWLPLDCSGALNPINPRAPEPNSIKTPKPLKVCSEVLSATR